MAKQGNKRSSSSQHESSKIKKSKKEIEEELKAKEVEEEEESSESEAESESDNAGDDNKDSSDESESEAEEEESESEGESEEEKASSDKKEQSKVDSSSDEEEEDDSDDDDKEEEEEKKDSTPSKVVTEKKKTTKESKSKPKEEIKEDNDSSIITQTTFASLGIHPSLLKATDSLKWTSATRIQRETLPYALAGKDVIGLAETGSGKTGAFTIPILQSLLSDADSDSKTNIYARGIGKYVYAIILAPTRELAFQIHEVCNALGLAIGATSVCIVGGVDSTSQAISLAKNPHIVIATPGRLVDHLQNTKGFSLKRLRYLILDEADRMLSMDFEEEINMILSVIPDSSEGRRTMLFSATMTSKVQKLQRASLSSPVRVEVSTKFQTPETLLQYYLFIPAKYKDCYLTYLINEFAGQTILVFGGTCNNVQRIALLLRNLGFPAVCLHGQMSQPKRLGALAKFKSGSRDILICTDVASRGLDIPSVDVVINFDLPGHGKDYIHRVGRTARAGRSGKAVAMVTQYDVEVYQRLEGLLGQKLPQYKLDEETVLVLLERVSEAQRLATRELKEQQEALRRGRKGKKGRGGDDDGEEGRARGEIKRGYKAGGRRGGGNKGRSRR